MSEDYNKLDRRVKTTEEAVQLLTYMARRADERMDDFDASLSNLTVKVEALADAQIRIEETLSAKIEALADAQIRTQESLARLADAQANLAEAQAHTDKRLDALIDIVREGRNGQ